MTEGRDEALSIAIEARLVDANPRGMRGLRAALLPGYCLRAAHILCRAKRVLIGTGFPVQGTFETDGPPGALALYRALEALGATPRLACAVPLAEALGAHVDVHELKAFDRQAGRREALDTLAAFAPDAIVSIERPGLCADGRYYNMRGEDISRHCAVFDDYLICASCPTIAIGDGGNEIGMGRVAQATARLNIRAAATGCDELIVADVSNWGAYALVALMQHLSGAALLDAIDHRGTLHFLSALGSVDGITRQNTATEDGLPLEAGEALVDDLARLVADAGIDTPPLVPSGPARNAG